MNVMKLNFRNWTSLSYKELIFHLLYSIEITNLTKVKNELTKDKKISEARDNSSSGTRNAFGNHLKFLLRIKKYPLKIFESVNSK